MLEADLTLAAMAERLAKSADYRVLRRLVHRETSTRITGQSTKTAILLDVETPGLDQRKDEITELGMIKFDYQPDGRIAGLRDVFSSFNEPSEPVPPDVIALVGITNGLVAGHRIDEAAVSSFAEDAVIVNAHNAGFDRRFAERYQSLGVFGDRDRAEAWFRGLAPRWAFEDSSSWQISDVVARRLDREASLGAILP
ncbi:exonuclease domain-containing protein [Bradyrhizobium genosp. A]|uniref:exonuclease domain-containing protein n=1 Tax=Bradyrhizobium genosp. A TaxID=83626 RepID=UPI003CF7CB4A